MYSYFGVQCYKMCRNTQINKELKNLTAEDSCGCRSSPGLVKAVKNT